MAKQYFSKPLWAEKKAPLCLAKYENEPKKI